MLRRCSFSSSVCRGRFSSSTTTAVVSTTASSVFTTTAAAAPQQLSQIGGMRHNSTVGGTGEQQQEFRMPSFTPGGGSEYPIVQLPAENLHCKQPAVSLSDIKTPSFKSMLGRLMATRSHYQYPSISAPQIGWNLAVFTLYDNSVWINPKLESLGSSEDEKNSCNECWTWEPCASCSFLMHYIKRPHKCCVSYYDADGQYHEKVALDGMRSRLVQHELDHMNGILFTRRIPNSLHVVPMDGFNTMSEWADDFPSLEARSTNLFSLFFPPLKFVPHFIEDSEMLKRHYEDNVFPGHEVVRDAMSEEEKHQTALQAFIEHQKKQGLWQGSKFSRVRKAKQAEREEQQQHQRKDQQQVEAEKSSQ